MVRTIRRAAAAGQEGAPRLVLDLDTFRLAGVGCGDPAARLHFLGPGCACAAAGEWEYPAHGLTLAVQDGRVVGFLIHVRPRATDVAAGMSPFAGALCHRGAAFDPAKIACEADVAEQFGAPAAVRQLADGWALRYGAGRLVWEVVLSADGRLATVRVSLAR